MNKMYKKRLIILSILFIATGVLAFWSFSESSRPSSYHLPSYSISFSDTSAITTIKIVYGNKQKFLSRDGRNWIINNKYKVRSQLVTLLLFALNKIEIKRPVQNNKENIVELIKKENLEVSITERENQHSFLVASNPGDVNSSYYLGRGSSDPYIVYVPGVKGEISNLLKLDINEWRSRDIFKSTVRSLEKISVIYTDRKQEGFEIVYKAGTFRIPGLNNVDSVKLKKYLSLFGVLGGDKYITSDSIISKIKNLSPSAIIKVKDIDTIISNTLKLFFLDQKLYGMLEKQKEILLLNPQIFKYVLIDKKYFEKK